MSDWNASRYHRVSGPQFDWGQRVIARLKPRPGETILDLGCGTARLAREILSGMVNGRVIGLDRSAAMLMVARATAAGNGSAAIVFVQADGAALPFDGVIDAVFSAATLHWIHDHEAVFRAALGALKPGGRLVAQCGGAGNLHRLIQRATSTMTSPLYAPFFQGWRDPWYFADARTTAERLGAAGFVDVETSLEESPVHLGEPAAFSEFIAVVCIRHHLDRLPPELRDGFTRELTEAFRADTPPYVLDYQRLNISARKPAR